MTESGRKTLLIWLALSGLLTVILIFQTALWPHTLRSHGLTAQFSLPILLYYSLHTSPAFILSLFYGISLLSMGFIAAPFINIFAAYTLIYALTLFSRDFYHWREFRFFFTTCGIWAILFPLVLDILSRFSTQPHLTAPPLYLILINALLTSLWGALLYPILNQTYQNPRL